MRLQFALAFALLWASPHAQPPGASQPEPVAALVATLQRAALAADREAIRALGRDRETLTEFALALTMPPPERVVIQERDRTQRPEGGHQVLVEIFWERGIEARLSTWTLDVVEEDRVLRVVNAARVANVAGLFRLSLNPARQFDVRNLTVRGPDLSLHMSSGAAFVAETSEGVTAVVLIGKGEMRFAPPDAAERTQVRLFSGREALVTPFDAAFVRLRPDDFENRFPPAALQPRVPSAGDLRRASAVFDEYVGRSLQINLAGLSPHRWSITPQPGDLIVEVRTKKFGSLTYTRSREDAEDVTLFDRRRRRNISVYASAEKLAERGRFYSEDDLVDYDVLSYDLEAAIHPERQRIDAVAQLRLRIRAAFTSTLNLRLAEELSVSSVHAAGGTRLLHLRVVNQNALIVSLPATMVRGAEVTLRIAYAGPLPPQEMDREAVEVERQDIEPLQIPPEPRYLYSNRTYWYPQASVSDYATVKLGISVPGEFDVAATGLPSADDNPLRSSPSLPRGFRRFAFESSRPVRYLACVVSRLRDAGTVMSTAPDGKERVRLMLLANPRQQGRARTIGPRAADIFGLYTSLVGDAPYPGFTLVLTERDVPGGHSPAYFAMADQPVQGLSSWRDDPVNFDTYPDFFIAHEIAHQWWGQGVGWKNYHEQWLSEGFAQYFAAIYAERRLSPGAAANVFRRMRQTAIAQSPNGPVFLGYRLGHVVAQPRILRSILYNKGAMVLHMLRRLLGDEAFFNGVRTFYNVSKFQKAGTEDLRMAMERASGRDLAAFFEAWIHGIAIPEVRFTHRTDDRRLVLRFEQQEPAMEFPVTVRIVYRSGESETRIISVRGGVTEQALEVRQPVREVTVNGDHGALANFR